MTEIQNEGQGGTWSCRACKSPAHPLRLLRLRESMFGTGEVFTYGLCGGCGSLSIVRVPANLAAYYPETYYSHESGSRSRPGEVLLVRFLQATGLAALLPIGVPGFARWTARAHAPRSARILDVGSGSGDLLHRMANVGFQHLTGVDPYLQTSQTNGRVTLHRAEVQELEGPYDLIMMNHSLEHVPEPIGMLQSVRRLLAPRGVLLVRVPVLGSVAWNRYGQDWVQLDPPRHLTIFTREAIRDAARAASFQVLREDDDSNSFQFWGSEERRAGLPLVSPRSRARHGGYRRLIDPARWWWGLQAHLANRAGRGDSIALYLTR